MNGLKRQTRLQIMLDEEELAALDDWRFEQRMPSRAAAIRELLRFALRAHSDVNANSSMRSEDFGVIDKD